ncbi:hypothetical protein ACFOD0_15505 [Shewanella intestini]|uniref:Uncharacterized protein n=1 Tax=Shewanella intestini TaxID=2017544 RepID=A0ABS5I500_9GAMM|nr:MULTISPECIES: hypothetical protein [Shewanella]MBR9729105.1 hypothetical protein [Shewanella intestini]MRG37181.1 hypothetical protein [Shewanella sp. XMDDZSB0408]
MNKRRWSILKAALATSGLAVSGSIIWHSIEGNQYPLTVTAMLARLTQMQTQSISLAGEWTLTHCAQSAHVSV